MLRLKGLALAIARQGNKAYQYANNTNLLQQVFFAVDFIHLF